jgi:hypothetical protein
MSPEHSGPLAYWHSGGAIESRSGPLTRVRAQQLLRFYADEVAAGFDRDDLAAALHCVRASLDLAAAMVAADAWRAAAQVRVSHEISAIWLRKR